MTGLSKLLMAGMALIGLLGRGSAGELRQVQEGVLVEDFEDGGLDQFAPDAKPGRTDASLPAVLEVAKDAGKGALHLKGQFHTRAYLRDRTFKDFALTARLRKAGGSYAGLVVRDHWRVYFQMKCFLSLNSDAPGLQSKGELLKSAETFPGYHDLKVICAGPLLHAYVDDKLIFRHKITAGEGRLGVYAHGGGEAWYDELRIETRVGPEHYVLVEPLAPEGCLVFPPSDGVKLAFQVSDYGDSPRQVALTASVKTWPGEAVTRDVRRLVRTEAGGQVTATFDMGRIAPGFYRVDLQASSAGKEVGRFDDLPLAVQQRETGTFKAPVIPIGAYYKYFNSTSPVYRNTYAHAAARGLKDHHFNAVVADPSFTREVVDIFQSYGIATIARGEAFLDHPAAIGTLTSDEPKPDEIDRLRQDYEKLRARTDKPFTTCMVGEGIGLGGPGDPVVMWRQLAPPLRCFRWYGVKKSFYGLLHDVKYKGWLPLSSVLRIAESSADTPYWFVAPALGKTVHEAYYHKPTPAETRGLMHLALAYGADGILFWAFQSHGSWPCFVEQKSLAPTDGNYAAAAEVAAKVAAHAELIKSLEHAGLDIRCPSPVVDAVPRKDARDGKLYVYAVNRDAKAPASTRLMLWAETWPLTTVRDIYADKDLPFERDEEGYWAIPLTLAPGDGRLLAVNLADKK